MKPRRKVGPRQNGLFSHSNPPKVVSPHPSVIRQWLRGGDVAKLESVVIQGQGHKLLGEYASDLKVRAFLKTVPAMLARMDMVHEAADKGNLTDLRTLLTHNADNSFPRKRLNQLALSKDHSGAGVLHKAVYQDHRDMVLWLVQTFPNTVHVTDREGRSALHYSGRCGDPEWMWNTLLEAGADSSLLDSRGRSPAYYMDNPQDAKLPTSETRLPPGRFTSGNNGLVVKPANIRIWIHDQDLGRLQQVVWEGYGDKLRTETSQHPAVKQFLSAVPYIMGVIKDVHSAAIKNDLALLKKRTAVPVPQDILLAKDSNGLTPLHKAAGLGHVEMVKAILAACPEAIDQVDKEGKTALHYAAAVKGSGAIYDTLIDHQARENVLDKKGNLPSYYIQNPKEIDQRVLTVIPEAPRTANTFPPSWDWGLLGRSNRSLPPIPSNNNDSAFEDMAADETPENTIPHDVSEEAVRKSTAQISRPQTYDVDADEGVEEEQEEKERGYNADSDEQEGHYEAEYAEVDPDYELENGPVKPDDEDPPVNNNLPEEEENRIVDIEGEGKEENGQPVPELTVDSETRIRRAVESGNMEELASLVLSGEGEALARHRSSDPDVQMFIDNIPNYITKIQKVHKSSREGNLRELQSALDRRKFAVARESSSKLKLTPLHLAVLYERIPVIKFLCGRFPETLRMVDSKGRSPLHYAATIRDSEQYYNMLATLGADKNLEDLDGKTPEYYLSHPEYLSQEELKAEFESNESLPPVENKPQSATVNKGISGKAVVSSSSGFPLFGPEDGQYLASSLGQPLIKGLTEVASRRPPNPVKYLARYLDSYEGETENKIEGSPKVLEKTYTVEKDRQLMAPPVPLTSMGQGVEEKVEVHQGQKENQEQQEQQEQQADTTKETPEGPQTAFKPVQRDEFGQTILHFAMARTHSRNSVIQLLQEVDCNIGYRDELYRTPRDVAVQVNIVDNIAAIDKYVVSLAANGQLDRLRELLAEGYDHIVDAYDESAAIIEVANERGQTAVLGFLDSIVDFEEKRERLHRAIRMASAGQVQDMLKTNPGLAVSKNQYCRCSLHIAVLNQHDQIVQHIANSYPQTLVLGDNLMRTPLHYAMGVERVETLSKILIQAGAARVVKDLKGRQPSYYFMNKSDIQKLQDEEDMLRI